MRRRLHHVVGVLYRLLTSYYVSRVFQAVFTFYIVLTISFVLIRFLPGGPMDALEAEMRARARDGEDVNLERVDALVEAYLNVNPSAPLWEQYVSYVTNFATGDMGTSIWYGQPVIDIIAKALPWTLFIMASATFLSFVIGILLGMLMAYFERSKFDTGTTLLAVVATSTPFFVLAIVLLFAFSYQLNWMPPGGQRDPYATAGMNLQFVQGVLFYGILPIMSMVIASWGGRALNMRANAIQMLGEDFIRVARLRGLTSFRISTRYVGRNAVLPLYTGLMIGLGNMFGGAIILEEIFNYPGVGYYMLQAINARDYPLMMAGFMMITAAVIVGILFADLTYGFIDPRIQQGGNTKSYQGGGRSFGSTFRTFYQRLKALTSEEAAEGSPAGVTESPADIMASLDMESSTEPRETRKDRLFRVYDQAIHSPFMVLWSDWRGRVSIFIISLYLLAGTVGVLLVPRPYSSQGGEYVAPFTSLQFPLGTDKFGQDLLGLMIHATPAMLEMITAGALFATIIATAFGVVAGFRGGLVDRALMTFADIAMTIPGLPLTIILAAILSPEQPWIVGVLLTVNAWGGTSRQIRSQVLTVRESEYVEASRTIGLPTSTILLKDIVPNILPFALMKFVAQARGVIFGSVGLYFLGILPFSTLNWGVVLNLAYTSSAPLLSWNAVHWLLVPMGTITLLSIGLVLFAQAADRLTNPRVRARHAKTTDTGDDPEIG